MPETTASSSPTLGQRLDALLAPLYAEADQHRETLTQAKSQMAALQQQIDQADQGLTQIESRMAQVVRSLAGDEPVIAAALGGASASESNNAVATTEAAVSPAETQSASGPSVEPAPAASAGVDDPQPAPPADEPSSTSPASEDQVQPTATPAPAEAVAKGTADESEPSASQPAEVTEIITTQPPTASTESSTPIQNGEVSSTTVPLDLDPEQDQAMVDEAASLLDSPPPADITAAAERAVAAAKALREKAEPAA